MTSIAKLNLADFEKRVGETFTLDSVKAVLKSAEPGKTGHKAFRAPVSLIFEPETELSDTSAVFTLDHPDMGAVAVMAQRIMAGEEDGEAGPPTYQIVLN
jgi:hypothetical protein